MKKAILLLITVLLISFSNEARAQNIFHLQLPLQPTCQVSWEHSLLDLNNLPIPSITKWTMALNGNETTLTNVIIRPEKLPNGNTSYYIPCPAFVVGNTILVIFAWIDALKSTGSPEIQIIVDPPIKVAPRPATGVKAVQ